jgi:hypothetical protein
MATPSAGCRAPVWMKIWLCDNLGEPSFIFRRRRCGASILLWQVVLR